MLRGRVDGYLWRNFSSVSRRKPVLNNNYSQTKKSYFLICQERIFNAVLLGADLQHGDIRRSQIQFHYWSH